MAEPEYRVADLELLPAGADQALVYARDTGAAGYYRAGLVELLTGCQQFRTIEEHVRAHLDAAGGDPGVLRRELARLARAGFLIARDELALTGQPPTNPPPISTVGFPTCDRPDLLRRAITSYAGNTRRHGRSAGFVVVDDSAKPATRNHYRAMLAELAGTLRIEISYAGRDEKIAFADRLAAAGDLPSEVVRFGCLGAPLAGVSIGANRNALLLHTVGESILSADDDTVAELARAPEQQDLLYLDSDPNPLQLWYFGNREQAIAATSSADTDLLALHERFLGARPAAVLAAAGDAASFERAEPALLNRLGRAAGRIRVTATGTVGDCGWDNGGFHLFQHPASLARLAASAAGEQQAGGGRELIQAVSAATITDRPDPKFAMCLGLDNAELLAPFPPVGRAEEVAFAAILACCFTDSYGALLPWLIQHRPAGERQFSNAPMFTIGLSSWLPSCLARFDPGLDRSPTVRLDRLGRFLGELGRLAAGDFDEFVRLGIFDSMSAQVSELTDRLDGEPAPPAYWARDARRYLADVRRDALLPVSQLYAATGGRAMLQQLLVRLGELLSWWPAIVTTAGRLRAEGHRLATPVN